MYWEIFKSFFRIGILSFGGGYAMLPLLQREMVEKQGWATDEELADYFAVGQCTPGIIMVNTATFIGYKLKGVFGGIFATLSVILPSYILLLIIALLLRDFAEYPLVQNAFAGIRVCVAVLIFNTVCKLFQSGVKDRFGRIVFAAVFVLSLCFELSPVLLVLAAGAAGLGLQVWRAAK